MDVQTRILPADAAAKAVAQVHGLVDEPIRPTLASLGASLLALLAALGWLP